MLSLCKCDNHSASWEWYGVLGQIFASTIFYLKEVFVLPIDAENARESHKRDIEQLNNKLSDLNEELRIREKDYQMTIDDARKNEIKSFEKLKNLENLLDNANQVNTYCSVPQTTGG